MGSCPWLGSRLPCNTGSEFTTHRNRVNPAPTYRQSRETVQILPTPICLTQDQSGFPKPHIHQTHQEQLGENIDISCSRSVAFVQDSTPLHKADALIFNSICAPWVTDPDLPLLDTLQVHFPWPHRGTRGWRTHARTHTHTHRTHTHSAHTRTYSHAMTLSKKRGKKIKTLENYPVKKNVFQR